MVTRMTMSEPMAMSALMRPIFSGESGRAEEVGAAVSGMNSLSEEEEEPEMEFEFGLADASSLSRSF